MTYSVMGEGKSQVKLGSSKSTAIYLLKLFKAGCASLVVGYIILFFIFASSGDLNLLPEVWDCFFDRSFCRQRLPYRFDNLPFLTFFFWLFFLFWGSWFGRKNQNNLLKVATYLFFFSIVSLFAANIWLDSIKPKEIQIEIPCDKKSMEIYKKMDLPNQLCYKTKY